MAAICGKSCSIVFGSDAYLAHQFTLSLSGNEIDVTAFGSGEYGDYLSCNPAGTVSAELYEAPGLSIGDTVTVVMTWGETTLTGTGAIVTSIGSNVDAKGVAGHSIALRLVGDLA